MVVFPSKGWSRISYTFIYIIPFLWIPPGHRRFAMRPGLEFFDVLLVDPFSDMSGSTKKESQALVDGILSAIQKKHIVYIMYSFL
jgi:hypothetical protein